MGPKPRRLAFALVATLAAAGCASAPPKPSDVFVWPAKPDKPRVRYVRTLRSAADLQPASAWERFRRAFVGTDHSVSVFNPTALALSPDETKLYVSCTSTSRVLEFDFTAGAVRLVANEGAHRPSAPFGLATDAGGNLYVSGINNRSVLVYSAGGSFLREIGRDKLDRPTAIAIDRRRQLLYVTEGGRVDSLLHQVEVFALDGRHLRTIGKRGPGPGEFNFPAFLAISSSGTLYVADSLNFRIQMFDPDGNLIGSFGTQGTDPGGFNKIKGIAFDNAGLLHVADGANMAVQMFNASQQLLMWYGSPGMNDGLMAAPNGLAIDSKNHIYVADLMGDRVTEYVLQDTSGAEETAGAAAPTSQGDPAAARGAAPAAPSAQQAR